MPGILYKSPTFTPHFLLSDKSKQEIVTLGGVTPLLDLARSRDLRVQRNATGALLNLTHLGMMYSEP